MNRNALILSAVFCLLVFGVGLVQAGVDLAGGERPQALNLFTEPPTEQHLRLYEKELEDGSWFAQAIRPWVQYANFRLFGSLGEKAIAGKDGWLYYRPDVQYLIQPLPDLGAVKAITAFKEALSERGIHLLVIPVPGKPSIYPQRLTSRAEAAGVNVSVNTLATMQRLRDNGIEVMDLHDVLAPSETPATADAQTYLIQDTHWSPPGMKLAAQATAKRLLELGWSQRSNTAYEKKAIPMERQGDVLKMIRVPQIEACFADQNMICEQIIDPATGQPYADNPASDVLILGDSFLRIYQRDEPGSAGFVAHLADALGHPMASIINDGGASTLVRQELSRRPELLAGKKVVVWEFVERDLRFGTEGWQIVPLPEASGTPAA